MENNISEIPINQKEYLKKYLGIGKAPGEKKRRKKKPIANSRVQIIDDDADANTPIVTIAEDPLIVNEDAPQIVAIIDERPPSLRVDEKTKNPLWQPIGVVEDSRNNEPKQMMKGFKIGAKSNDKVILEPPRKKKTKQKSDESPPRKSRNDDSDVVVKVERRSESPKRKDEERDVSQSRSIVKQEKSPDNSPPRRYRRNSDDSSSRKSRRDDDISPPRRNRKDSDNSPSRKSRREDFSPSRSIKRDNDISPPRRRRNDSDSSPPRKSRSSRIKDISPSRRSKTNEHSTSSKVKRDSNFSKVKSSSAPERKSRFDNTSPRQRNDEASTSKKMDKTLDGKTAGLQNARELIEETQNFHKREDTLFKSLNKEVSGENAETVFRDRKSGRIRNLDEEEDKQRKKREEEAKNKEKYERWGRGLAQVESREQKIQEELHEMSKPLARYADDEDLEKYLKEQEREGDPMLAYIRKKKRKKAVERGETIKPLFEGEFMPNRYGIRPGHRWDGVDRSNGYEKKWFEVQNAKKAQLEDSYKWSTEDM